MTETRIPSHPTRVLVVDDHPFFRDGIMAWIGRQTHYVPCGHADSPLSALHAIAQLKPDVVLLDLHLRDGDGFELLRNLKNCVHQPHVIVVSHKDETIFAERALREGARGYVLKEDASELMLAAMDAVLSGGIYVSSAMRQQLSHAVNSVDRVPAGLHSLYSRELQVLRFLGRGRTTKEIALELGISPKTVETYRENLKKKLHAPDSLTLVRWATIWEHEGKLS